MSFLSSVIFIFLRTRPFLSTCKMLSSSCLLKCPVGATEPPVPCATRLPIPQQGPWLQPCPQPLLHWIQLLEATKMALAVTDQDLHFSELRGHTETHWTAHLVRCFLLHRPVILASWLPLLGSAGVTRPESLLLVLPSSHGQVSPKLPPARLAHLPLNSLLGTSLPFLASPGLPASSLSSG